MANIVVTTLDDGQDPTPTDNGLSLREALDVANTTAGADTIIFAEDLSGVINLALGELQITDQLLIDGDGRITVSGDRLGNDVVSNGFTDVAASLNGADCLADNTRLFSATTTALDVAFEGLTLTGGRTTQNVDGGGAFTSADGVTVTITDSVIAGNSTSGAGSSGGALNIGSEITLTGSRIVGNRTSGDFADGGGLVAAIARIVNSQFEYNATEGRYADGGGTLAEQALELIDSILNGNSVSGYAAKGGAVFAAASASILNSVAYGNETKGAYGDGGAIFGNDTVTVSSSTLTGNAATGSGAYGGAIFSSGDLTVQNSIILGNAAPNGTRPEVSLFDSFGGFGPEFSFLGQNIVGAGPQSFDATVSDNVVNASADQVFAETVQKNGQAAGVLADNGGDLKSVALNPDPGNPALDASNGDAPDQDLRGVDVFDFPGVGLGGAQRDLGSFEVDSPAQQEPEARSLVVTTTADVVDAYDGVTSLREAVTFANEKEGADLITFAAGGQGVIRLTQGALDVMDALEVDGAGRVTITGDRLGDDITILGGVTDVDASQLETDYLADNSRIFEATNVDGSFSLVLTGLTLTGGRPGDDVGATGSGGAVRGVGVDIQARNSVFVGNTTGSERLADGGAIDTDQRVELVNSIVADNRSSGQGGGVSAKSLAIITHSTITGNVSGSDGGGVALFEYGDIRATNSIILGNVAGTNVHNDITSNRDPEGISDTAPLEDLGFADSIDNPDFIFRGVNIVGGQTASSFNAGGSEAVFNANPEAVFAETTDNGTNVPSGVLSRDGAGRLVIALKADEANPALDVADADLGTSEFQVTDLVTDLTGAPRSFDQVGLDNGGTADLGAVELQTQVQITPPTPAGPTPGPDALTGDGDANVINGLRGADTISGLGGADTLNGGGGRDVITGNGGGDAISGGGGGDTIAGNGGRDVISGGGGRDDLEGGVGRDQVSGDGGRDAVKGGGGADILEGGGGRDFLDGGRGRDLLDGSNGADTLVGGKGNDTLTGGGGLDTFRFTRGDGRDTITDFDQFRDTIEIVDGAERFEDLVIMQSGNNVSIKFANVVITVEDDLAENFTAADFIFS